MSQAVRISDLSERFYVPRFELTIGGRELDDRVVRDVIELKYTDNVEEIDAFELTLNNWDASRQVPKYEPPAPNVPAGLFDPGGLSDPEKKIELRMGYGSRLELMLTGEVTTLEPSFPASAGLTLAVRGLNLLHRFRTAEHTYAWTDMRDSEIAHQLGQWPVDDDRPGLGIEVRTDPFASEPTEPYVLMDNTHDILFLLNRARRRGYELVLRESEQGEAYLYFGPSDSRREPPAPYRLEWGKSLISFRPTLSTANQVSEVTVRGWDRRRHQKIEVKKTWQDLVPAGPERQRMEALAAAFGNRKLVITDQPVHTEAQAENLAETTLRNRLKGMVTAKGETIGLPGLRAGRTVEISNLGPRFDGRYFITASTHTIGDNGYRTELEARREGGLEGAGASSSPAPGGAA